MQNLNHGFLKCIICLKKEQICKCPNSFICKNFNFIYPGLCDLCALRPEKEIQEAKINYELNHSWRIL